MYYGIKYQKDEKTQIGLGLMSGTSLDGVDVAVVLVKEENGEFNYHLIGFDFLNYEKDFKEKILRVEEDNITIFDFARLQKELSYVYEKAINKTLKKYNLKNTDIAFIGCHGQTICHNPNDEFSYTVQAFDANYLAYKFNTTIVYDFRNMDLCASGQGAPLVPKVEQVLYAKDFPNIYVNIGGITNITYLDKKNCIAFDTGPGNMLIDGAMRKLFNQEYDDNGQTSKKGILNEQALSYLLTDEYYKLPYPKSTGREYFNDEYLEKAIKMFKDCGSNDSDVITTLTYLTAIHLTKSIKRFFPNLDENSKIFLNGGGAHNSHLVEIIRANMPQEVIIGAGGNEELVDAKEAMSFAVLAHLTLNHKPGNVTTVTGAKEEVVLGSVIFAPRKE